MSEETDKNWAALVATMVARIESEGVGSPTHEKAITGDDFVVVGSMNITNNGVFVREEFLEFRVDEEFVARSRMDAYERFGGVL